MLINADSYGILVGAVRNWSRTCDRVMRPRTVRDEIADAAKHYGGDGTSAGTAISDALKSLLEDETDQATMAKLAVSELEAIADAATEAKARLKEKFK